jgi:hypothetical protein
MSGSSEVWFIQPTPSFGANEDYEKASEKEPLKRGDAAVRNGGQCHLFIAKGASGECIRRAQLHGLAAMAASTSLRAARGEATAR